jgi:hypothetical protein
MDATNQESVAGGEQRGIVVVPRAIRGRVDAIIDGRVQGWAWHPDKSGERLTIEVLAGGTCVLTVSADQARVDLRRNGVGDGSHAFDLTLDPALALDPAELEFRAVASTGDWLTLRVASTDERAAEAAVSVPLGRVLERLDLLLAVQRQLAIGQRETLAGTKALTERVGTLAAEGGAIDTAVSKVSQSQSDLVERVASIEVFLTRFDSTLAGFDKRLTLLQAVGKNEVKPIVIMLSTILGFVVGALLVAFVPH